MVLSLKIASTNKIFFITRASSVETLEKSFSKECQIAHELALSEELIPLGCGNKNLVIGIFVNLVPNDTVNTCLSLC